MQYFLQFLALRRSLAVYRPEHALLSRQASLTSAINRGIRKTKDGVDSLERRTSARPSRETGEETRRRTTWRAGDSDPGKPWRANRSFTQQSRNTERSADDYGRDEGSVKWQPRSANVRGDDRDKGTYSHQRYAERDDYGLRRTPRSSASGRKNFKSSHDTGSQSINKSLINAGPNRKERRAAVFGTQTWSDSSPRAGRGKRAEGSTQQNYGRESLERFGADEVEYNGRGFGDGQKSPLSFGSNRYTKENQSKISARPKNWDENSHDYGDSDKKRKEKDDDREEGKRFVRKGTVQPYAKVPLAIPYTTAGSEFLYGTHVVKAALQSGRRKLYKLYIYEGANSQGREVEQDNSIYKLALAAGVAVSKVKGEWESLLNKMSDQRPHNGYVLEASPVPKLPVTALEKVGSPSETYSAQLGHQSAEELAINRIFDMHGSLGTLPSVDGMQRYPFIVMLDRIRDPGNLGSIIRSAYFLGAEAIVLIEHGTAPIGPVALKSSASAAEYLPLLTVKNEHAFIRKSQENGWKFFGATSPDSKSALGSRPKMFELRRMNSALREGPCVLLLGSEGEGIRAQLQRIVNGTVGVGSARGSAQSLDSLNVSVAAALLMQEFLTGPRRAVPEPAAEITKEPEDNGLPQQALETVF